MSDSTPPRPPRLDSFESMWNAHLNNAFMRAKFEFIQQFGEVMWKQKFDRLERVGFMEIFNVNKVGRHRKTFLSLVCAFVNENRGDTPPPLQEVLQSTLPLKLDAGMPARPSFWKAAEAEG